jgi:hypothetical protein
MNIKSAKYMKSITIGEVTSIYLLLNDNDTISLSVPLDPENKEYEEIMRQVEAGKLTIQEADSD